MIDRTHRFRGQAGLKFLYRNARVVRGQYVSLKYVQQTRRPGGRVAVVVSKKVHKSAVVRNRIRRRLYEIYRQTARTDVIDMAFMVYDARLAEMPAPELKQIIVRLIDQVQATPRAIVNTKEDTSRS